MIALSFRTKPLFVLHLADYTLDKHRDLYTYSNLTDKTCTLSVYFLKLASAYVKAQFPELKHSVYAINSKGFTKASYLLYLQHIFNVHKVCMDSHVLKLIVDHIWLEQEEVRVSIKDVMYLLNGANIESVKGIVHPVEDWDILLPNQITDRNIIPSAVIVDIFLRNNLIIINRNSRKYSFNKEIIQGIPGPTDEMMNSITRVNIAIGGAPNFLHLTMRCKPEKFIQIARKHMAVLGIEEQADTKHEKGCLIT